MKGCRSRRVSNPAIASTSPFVMTTPASGDDRRPLRGCSADVASICMRRSGEVLIRNQTSPSAETASEACDRGRAAGSPPRARRHAAVFEFHCGKPPPAAAPKTIAYMTGSPERAVVTAELLPIGRSAQALFYDVSAGVTVDFTAQCNFNDLWGLPSHHFPPVFGVF